MNKIIILVALLLITGCSMFKSKPDGDVTVVACSPLQKADPLHMLNVSPYVVEDKSGVIWIGITPKHYENLSKNLKSIAIYIAQQKAIIHDRQLCIDRYSGNVE